MIGVFVKYLAILLLLSLLSDNVSSKSSKSTTRYLLYDVNPGEGFNLRRDVYMRMANLVKLLNEKQSWTLVLPPWGRLYHWQTRDIDQTQIPWSVFFDVESLRKHIPVIEFYEYLTVIGEPAIEEVYGLQRYAEGWGGKWEEKMDFRDCIDKITGGFVQDDEGKWHWHFWGYGDDVYARKFRCLSIQMEYRSVIPFLTTNTTARSVFLWRGEQVNHGHYSNWSPLYWTARRSMRFAKHLTDIGDEFRLNYLKSDDVTDNTIMDADWRYMERDHGDAKGGPYLAVHLRRKDFARSHKGDVPSLKGAIRQIRDIMQSQKLNTVFIATDAPNEEYEEIKDDLSKEFTVLKYKPSKEILMKYKDGGVAIIDQWICAHARYFIGTSVSTFSFRIHEEREILGFSQMSTYNRLCGDSPDQPCEQSTKWNIQYEHFEKPKEEL